VSLALLVTGAGGGLARSLLDLVRSERNAFARGLSRAELDLQDPFGVQDVVRLWARILQQDSPDHRLVVVNTAACSSPEQAEADEERAYGVNAAGPALLAQACASVGARLIHVSCADVFSGDRGDGPAYDVDDEVGPRSAYGRTKLGGELAVRELHPDGGYVVRTSWLYGGNGEGMVPGLIGSAEHVAASRAPDDQWGSPTWTRDLAAALIELARSSAPAGTYHCASSGRASWFELGRSMLDDLGADPTRIVAVRSDELPSYALRPASAVLSSRSWEQAGLAPLRPWREGVSAYVAALVAAGPAVRVLPADPTATPSAAPASTSDG
jgi:dTDP-4-dehydrorhamnose reductase